VFSLRVPRGPFAQEEKRKNMNKTLSKSQKRKTIGLALLDAEDAKIPANPGLNNQASGGEFEKLFSASTKEQDFRVGDVSPVLL